MQYVGELPLWVMEYPPEKRTLVDIFDSGNFRLGYQIHGKAVPRCMGVNSLEEVMENISGVLEKLCGLHYPDSSQLREKMRVETLQLLGTRVSFATFGAFRYKCAREGEWKYEAKKPDSVYLPDAYRSVDSGVVLRAYCSAHSARNSFIHEFAGHELAYHDGATPASSRVMREMHAFFAERVFGVLGNFEAEPHLTSLRLLWKLEEETIFKTLPLRTRWEILVGMKDHTDIVDKVNREISARGYR